MLIPFRWLTFLVALYCASGIAFGQNVPSPPQATAGSWDVEPPRMQWTIGINGGILGYSPSVTTQLSGNSRFERAGNFGIGFLTDNEGRKRFSITANTSIGLSAGTMFANKEATRFHTIEGTFQKNQACYSFMAPFFFTFQGDTFAKWVMTDKYLYYGISYQYTFSVAKRGWSFGSDFMYVRGTIGRTFNHQNFTDRIEQGKFEDWSENGTGMKATTIQASRQSFMMSFELGFRNFQPDYDRSFDWGIVAHIPFTDTYTDQYEFVQSNVSMGVSNTTYMGTTVMLNFRYTFNVKPKESERDSAVPPPDIYATTDTSRDVDVQESFEVHNKHVRVRVWDRNEIDGDVVSLFFNDGLVKRNLKLKRRKKSFKLKLRPGSNILVMYAENLGDIPPNTAALEIKDGRKKRNVNLVSDNGKSGAVELIYVPK